MIYKTTSVKRVIAKVFTDLDLQEGEHRIADMIEWAGEALEKIGAFPSFENKITGRDGDPLLPLNNYITALPCDFHTVIQVSFSTSADGPFYPMRYTTGNFDMGNQTPTVSDKADPVPSTANIVMLAMTLYDWDYDTALTRVNSDPLLKSKMKAILNLGTTKIDQVGNQQPLVTDYVYMISSSYLKTNVRDGYIMMAYQAVPTDDEGYPMIPDDADFLEAIYWYITMKLLYPQWKQGSVRDQVYYDARRSWNYNCKKAYGNAMMPNIDQLESIKNSWLRLVPEIEEHATGFSYLGQRQRVYNQQ
jgi:hypothetical protein